MERVRLLQSAASITRPASPSPMRTTRSPPRAGEPGRRADQVRPRVHVRAEPGRQARALIEADCIRLFADEQPGKTVGRPELAACAGYFRAGDTLAVRAWIGCPGPCRA
jgi:hypothetical protein